MTKEDRKLKKDLQNLSNIILLYLDGIDNLIKNERSIPREISSLIAEFSNQLDMANDAVRYFSLGVDFRKDDKAKAVEKLKNKSSGADKITQQIF